MRSEAQRKSKSGRLSFARNAATIPSGFHIYWQSLKEMSAIITIIFLSGSHLLILLAFETRAGQLSKVAARTWGLSYADLQQRSKAHTLNGDDEPYVVADILFKIVAVRHFELWASGTGQAADQKQCAYGCSYSRCHRIPTKSRILVD